MDRLDLFCYFKKSCLNNLIRLNGFDFSIKTFGKKYSCKKHGTVIIQKNILLYFPSLN